MKAILESIVAALEASPAVNQELVRVARKKLRAESKSTARNPDPLRVGRKKS